LQGGKPLGKWLRERLTIEVLRKSIKFSTAIVDAQAGCC
jgi:hypothetical protein